MPGRLSINVRSLTRMSTRATQTRLPRWVPQSQQQLPRPHSLQGRRDRSRGHRQQGQQRGRRRRAHRVIQASITTQQVLYQCDGSQSAPAFLSTCQQHHPQQRWPSSSLPSNCLWVSRKEQWSSSIFQTDGLRAQRCPTYPRYQGGPSSGVSSSASSARSAHRPHQFVPHVNRLSTRHHQRRPSQFWTRSLRWPNALTLMCSRR